MYCASCGTAVTSGLSYCNRCGAELNGKGRSATKSSELSPETLVWAIVSVTLGGLALTIALMAMMKKELGINEGAILAFALLSFLFILMADGAFLWLLLRSKRDANDTTETAQGKGLTTKGLGENPARALPEPAMSVTEHTTRTLEPMREERKPE